MRHLSSLSTDARGLAAAPPLARAAARLALAAATASCLAACSSDDAGPAAGSAGGATGVGGHTGATSTTAGSGGASGTQSSSQGSGGASASTGTTGASGRGGSGGASGSQAGSGGDSSGIVDAGDSAATAGSACAALEDKYIDVGFYPSDTSNLTSTNGIAFHVQLTDQVFKGLNLSDITFRYWFTVDSNERDTLYFDRQYSQNGHGYVDITSMVSGSFHEAPTANKTATSDTYLEVAIGGDAGTMLPNGGTAVFSGVIRGPGATGYADLFDLTNDYSYSAKVVGEAGQPYASTETITAYYKGTLTSGCEPQAAGQASDGAGGSGSPSDDGVEAGP